MEKTNIDSEIKLFVEDLVKEGFIYDGFFYENNSELVRIDNNSNTIQFVKKDNTQEFGTLTSHIEFNVYQISKAPKPLLQFLRDKIKEEVLQFAKKNSRKNYKKNLTFSWKESYKNEREGNGMSYIRRELLDFLELIEITRFYSEEYDVLKHFLKFLEVESFSTTPPGHKKNEYDLLEKIAGKLNVTFKGNTQLDLEYFYVTSPE